MTPTLGCPLAWLAERTAWGVAPFLLLSVAGGVQAMEPLLVSVPGNANPYLSGAVAGTPASNGDRAPDQSPVWVRGLRVQPGRGYTFAASGRVNHGGTVSGPDGGPVIRHAPGAQNGIAGVTLPINALLGVFLDDRVPSAGDEAEDTDFSTGKSRDAFELEPALNQIFFIGDGLTSDGEWQVFFAPKGATRLFLGTMDGYGWYNNSGSFMVEITPRP